MTISNNVIAENYSGFQGGGISCWDSSIVQITNNTLYGNKARFGLGGGIYIQRSSTAGIFNSILWADSAYLGNEVYIDTGAVPIIMYSNIQGGWEGQGNIDTDPLFRDPANGDFHLMSTECGDPYDSPCIDSGSPAIIDSLLDCSWGLGTILSDMGAYGGGDSGTVGIDNYIDLIPKQIALLQSYPNPFNAATSINFTLPEPSNIVIEIYNILGQRVEGLFDGSKPAGSHSVIWNATGVPSGVYFARMVRENGSQNAKMALLK